MLNTKKKKFDRKAGQKGVSIFLALVIMTILLGIVLGLNSLLLGQIKIIREAGDSVKAFYAADSGIERALYNIRKESGSGNVSENWGTNYGFETTNSPCGSKDCLKSTGTFGTVKRAIEAAY